MSYGDFNETALLFICVAASKAWGHDTSPWEGSPGHNRDITLSVQLLSSWHWPAILASILYPSLWFSQAHLNPGVSTVYRLPCTLQHWLNVNTFSLSVGSSTRRRTKVSAVIQNLINIKPQKHTPGLDAFPSHPCPLDRGAILAGVEEAALLSSPSGMCLVPTFQVGFSYCYFLITCILRMMLSFGFLKNE